MIPEFAASLSRRLQAFRHFAEGKTFLSCRLVHYAGAGRPNAADVSLGEVERQISGCLAEGFLVNWAHVDDRLYLCVQEPDCPIPSWKTVVAEEALVDVDALLRGAGFSNGA